MFAALPLLALPVAVYNLIVAVLVSGGFNPHAPRSTAALDRFAKPLFHVPTATGGSWPVGAGDLLIFVSLVLLFVELLKSTTSHRVAIINHSLSMLLFIVCLVEFLLFPAFANAAFFLVTTMVLLDVLAGFIVTIISARKDLEFGAG